MNGYDLEPAPTTWRGQLEILDLHVATLSKSVESSASELSAAIREGFRDVTESQRELAQIIATASRDQTYGLFAIAEALRERRSPRSNPARPLQAAL